MTCLVRVEFGGHTLGAEPLTTVVSMVTWTLKIYSDSSLEQISVLMTVRPHPFSLPHLTPHASTAVFMDIHPRRRSFHFHGHHGNRRQVRWLPWQQTGLTLLFSGSQWLGAHIPNDAHPPHSVTVSLQYLYLPIFLLSSILVLPHQVTCSSSSPPSYIIPTAHIQ